VLSYGTLSQGTPPRIALAQLFAVTTAAVAVVILGLFYAFLETSRESILRSSESLRAATAERIASFVERDLAEADQAIIDLEREINRGASDPHDPLSIESTLFLEMIRHDRFAEATFTAGRRLGFDSSGDIVLHEEGRWQISLVRTSSSAASVIETRKTSRETDQFIRRARPRTVGGGLLEAPFRVVGGAYDPTEHLTFKTTASATVAGRAIWSDLSYAESDADLPERQRRIVVTEQKVILDREGQFAGVLRIGLVTQTVDGISRFLEERDPHRVFLTDSDGRLITRLQPDDPIREVGDDLRVEPRVLPPAIATALASPLLREVTSERPEAATSIMVGSVRHLLTLRLLPKTQAWIVGILVPESAYTHDLEDLRRRLLAGFLVVIAFIAASGAFVLRGLRRSLGALVDTTSRMQEFDFSPSRKRLSFRDVHDVMDGIERAKTALRALERYVPIDLVRELYRENKESVLGAELREMSIMFTDIRGFTSVSERLPPDRLAGLLGLYLEAMTGAIRRNRGTIDKFIGDAVMAFWNAPTSQEEHARLACQAALDCKRSIEALFASPRWGAFAPFKTSFGIHRDRVMVGNFGAPDRMNYTVLGDGVNVAARLEGLCKLYGATIIVSEMIEQAVSPAFELRLLDRVAVKGRAGGIVLYELLGRADEPIPILSIARGYEAAFREYQSRNFEAAIELLSTHEGDPPSRALLERCRRYQAEPPSADWDGTYVATSK
jgi:adenylate cyclase